jgi:hypothetical protein
MTRFGVFGSRYIVVMQIRIARSMLWKVTERSEMVGFKIPAYRGIVPLEIEIAER